MTNDEIIDTLEYFKLNFAKDKKAIEHFDKAIEIIEEDSNRKASIVDTIKNFKYSGEMWDTAVPITIKSCPHLLPCGFCDKDNNKKQICNQYA